MFAAVDSKEKALSTFQLFISKLFSKDFHPSLLSYRNSKKRADFLFSFLPSTNSICSSSLRRWKKCFHLAFKHRVYRKLRPKSSASRSFALQPHKNKVEILQRKTQQFDIGKLRLLCFPSFKILIVHNGILFTKNLNYAKHKLFVIVILVFFFPLLKSLPLKAQFDFHHR